MNPKIELLRSMANGDIDRLSPAPDPSSAIGYTYEKVESYFEDEDIRDQLEQLASNGLLARDFAEQIHLCPDCERYELNFREVCAECSSSFLEPADMLHHYGCGYIGPENEFQSSGGFVCPKCDEKLRHIGVDYERVGQQYVCQDCGAIQTEPDVSCQCLACSKKFPVTDLSRISIYEYELTARGQSVAVDGVLPSESGTGMIRGAEDLYSASLLHDTIEREVAQARRYDHDVSLIVVEPYFDSVSNEGASTVRKHLARMLQASTRTSDFPANDGDKMVLLLPDTDEDGSVILARRLQEREENLNELLDQGSVTLHVGVAERKSDEGPDEFYKRVKEFADQSQGITTSGGRV